MACGKSFSQRSGTPLFRTQLPPDKVLQIALGEGMAEAMESPGENPSDLDGSDSL